jgi:putative PIN family toxin of toxin-antitoxin system
VSAFFESGRVDLFVSRATLAELRRVLKYDRILAISPNMTPHRVGAFLQRLTFRATLVRRLRHVMDYPRDPNDQAHIDLVVTVKAHYLVTSDRDLLDLMTGHTPLCKHFRRITRPLRVVDPITFLRTIDR